MVRGGALVAWEVPDGAEPERRFRIVGAHTDSPNLRIKPQPDTGAAGWQQLGVEVYGGALWNSWLDRDLGLSGRAVVRVDGVLEERLFHCDCPLLRIPQLAIHLDRDVNGKGLTLNPQQHLTPVWGVGPVEPGAFAAYLAQRGGGRARRRGGLGRHGPRPHPGHPAGSPPGAGVLGPTRQPGVVLGGRRGAGGRAIRSPPPSARWPVICLFDHEEVGSTSATGADSSLLATVLERTVLARGGGREHLLRALAGSVCASADMAHATHPNYPERHEPGHHVAIDGGPVVKVNANQRYATDAVTQREFVAACDRAGVPHQVFVGRNDIPCGSTIGPLTAARLGIATVDVGVAQLSMHSARELCGADDPARLAAACSAPSCRS